MKKLLQSSIILFLFSASLLLFDISCKKQANAKTSTTNAGKIVYRSEVGRLWIMNIDGTDRHEISITIPPTHQISTGPIAISGDGTKIILALGTTSNPTKFDLFTCNIDGSNLTKILDDPSTVALNYPYPYLVSF